MALTDVRLMLATPYASLRRGKLRDERGRDCWRSPARKARAGWWWVCRCRWTARLGPAAQAARDWTLALSEATGLPAALWDERLSTAAVNRFLIEEADLSRPAVPRPWTVGRRLDAAGALDAMKG